MSWKKEFKKLYNNPSLVIDNMKHVYQKCNNDDILQGKGWYKNANLFALYLSKKYNVKVIKVSGIISALSPQKSWEINMKITEEFLETDGKVTGHTKLQSDKARNILYNLDSKENIENCLSGLKTVNFFNNILNPKFQDYVTVDRHHIYLSTRHDIQNCTPKQYNLIKENTIIFAKELNIVPSELQSILWVCWKRIKKYEKENY
jgi:hypothetical protein